MSELRQGPSDGAPAVPTTTASTTDDVGAAALARVRDVTGELLRLARGAATQAVDGWSLLSVVRPLLPELDRVFEERDALDQELQLLRTDAADADERIRELEAQLAARETGWTAERAMLETEVGRERDQVQVLTEEVARRRAESELLATRERRVREQMEAVAARAHADREETLRLARDMVQSAEDARLAVVDEMDRLRAALADEQASLVEIEQERVLVSQDAAQRQAELARARQMIEQLEGSRTNANAELARARAKLVETESELLAAQHEYQLSQVQIDKLCSAHDDLVEDRAQLMARLHEAKEREARLRLRITGLEQRIQAVHDGRETPEDPPDAALDPATSELALELSRTEERARTLERELVKAKAAASAATLRVEALQDQTRAAEHARMAAEAELRSVRESVDDRRGPSAAAEPTTVTADVTAIDAEPVVVVDEPPVGGEPLETVTSTIDPEPAAADPAPAAGEAEPLHADDEGGDEELPIVVSDGVVPPAGTAGSYAVANDAATFTSVELEPMVAAEATLESPIVEDWAAGADTAIDPPASPDHEATPAHTGTAVVIDASGPWPSDDAATAHVLAPADATCDRLGELEPTCCVVNLGAPGAIDAVVALRAGDVGVPVFGCVATDSSTIELGRLDVVTSPVDPLRVCARLATLAARGANVVMVGRDSGVLIPLRQGVQQAGMSVKTAWNRTQALELADTVHPAVVIVDVASDAAETATLLCELARRADAPRLVLVVGTSNHDDLRAALLATAAGAASADRAAVLRDAVVAARG